MARARRTPEKDREAWLEAFRVAGTVTGACKRTGIGRRTVYDWRQKHEDFALAWADVEEETTERMEREAIRRGMEGFESDVYHQGQVVGTERKYSDTLLIFMLKARRPEKYRDNVHVQHGGKVDLNVTVDELKRMGPDELLDLARSRGVI